MFWEACTSCHQPIITMPSAYYLTATENAAWAREVLEAFADNHAKIHVGFKEEKFSAGLKRTSYSTLQGRLIQQYGAVGQVR